ncbi:hypothetical protein Scep_020738 [Stephania cephalantha]|uniref:UspA domain-containing protein n=1 Tax=Stephania cephalantha TaxID=152367 RepID=A0AAP0ID39_9MAGN
MFPPESQPTQFAQKCSNTANNAQLKTTDSEQVVVAVRAEKEISRTALAWALTHIVRPGDRIVLIAVFPKDSKSLGGRFWNFPRFTGDCGSSHRKRWSPDRVSQISESCSRMALQFRDQNNEVGVRIKVVSADGAVAAESKRVGAKWVILDK